MMELSIPCRNDCTWWLCFNLVVVRLGLWRFSQEHWWGSRVSHFNWHSV